MGDGERDGECRWGTERGMGREAGGQRRMGRVAGGQREEDVGLVKALRRRAAAASAAAAAAAGRSVSP